MPSYLVNAFFTGDMLFVVVRGDAAGLMVTGKNAKACGNMVVCELMNLFKLFTVAAVIFQRRN